MAMIIASVSPIGTRYHRRVSPMSTISAHVCPNKRRVGPRSTVTMPIDGVENMRPIVRIIHAIMEQPSGVDLRKIVDRGLLPQNYTKEMLAIMAQQGLIESRKVDNRTRHYVPSPAFLEMWSA